MFERIRNFRLSRRGWVGVVAVVFLVWFLFFRGGGADGLETMTVSQTAFAQRVSVSGTVVPAQEVELGFSQGGRISRVYVSVGDTVAEGTLIAEVENGDARSVVASKLAALQQQQANLESLLAGTRPEQIAVTQSQIESDKAALVQANQSLLNAIQDAFTTSDDAVRNQVDQFFSNPRSGSPKLTFSTSDSQMEGTAQNDRVMIESVLSQWQKDISSLDADGSVLPVAQKAQANLAVVMKLLTNTNAVLNSAITNQTVTQTVISGYITDISAARTSVNAAMSALTTAVSAQKSAAATLDKDLKSLALEQAGATSQTINVARAQVAAAEADLQNAQAQLTKTQIIAPFTGVISTMDAKRGAIAPANTGLVSMISRGTFQIEANVPEVDIANVKVGNLASTTLDAYGPSVFFGAKVVAIDPAQTVINGVSAYTTTLMFDKDDARIRSGMTASVSIETGGVPGAIVVPRGAVYDHLGQKTVQLLQEGKTVARVVTLGPSGVWSSRQDSQ